MENNQCKICKMYFKDDFINENVCKKCVEILDKKEALDYWNLP